MKLKSEKMKLIYKSKFKYIQIIFTNKKRLLRLFLNVKSNIFKFQDHNLGLNHLANL